MKVFIKQLLREMLDEARPTGHYNDRVNEVLYDIVSVQIPPNYYLPNIPEIEQNDWIIKQIQQQIQTKLDAIMAKDYPSYEKTQPKREGICVLIPLGIIKVKAINGMINNITITAKRKEGTMSGHSYYAVIYDNRIPSLVLANPKLPSNASPHTQLQAHMKNNATNGEPVNTKESFVDKSFMGNVIVDMRNYRPNQSS